jgi:hypothetical protein
MNLSHSRGASSEPNSLASSANTLANSGRRTAGQQDALPGESAYQVHDEVLGDWFGLDWIGLDWVRLVWFGLVSENFLGMISFALYCFVFGLFSFYRIFVAMSFTS